jgi:2-keto-4-pentenoate hydratase
MTRSRTISILVNKKTGDTFDAILNCPPKMMPDAKMASDGWWSFSTSRGKARLKFKEDKSLGILDHMFIDEESKWNVPMRIIPRGNESEVIITLIKPSELTDKQFDERMYEIEQVFVNMKKIIEL